MRLHILGIGGTFMGGVALLAKACGYTVSGSDNQFYPPMSTQLINAGIPLVKDYHPEEIDWGVDYVIVGNVIKRGNPAMEYILNHNIPYLSGPAWLAQSFLNQYWVLAVAGTHGKTTTSSLLAWILTYAGLSPGFLIGGIPENFGISAQFGKDFFVIEADEYDTAFFDKRSKFLHYRPKTLILNNLEYDHADIFPNLDAIKQQFHFLIRTVPGNGQIIYPPSDENLQDVIAKGCWTPLVSFGEQGEWQAQLIKPDGSKFIVYHKQQIVGQAEWELVGKHNVHNALAAIAAAKSVDVCPKKACKALSTFRNVKRRLEKRGSFNNITIYDDFAHHPTAIATTLAGLKAKISEPSRIIAVLEFGSYTMRAGIHKSRLLESLNCADLVICKDTVDDWGLKELLTHYTKPAFVFENVDHIVTHLLPVLREGDHVVIMSNSSFGGIFDKLLNALSVN